MLSSSSQIISRALPLNAIEVYISEIQLSPQGNYSYSTYIYQIHAAAHNSTVAGKQQDQRITCQCTIHYHNKDMSNTTC